MRVNSLLNSLTADSTEEEMKHVEEQKQYADFLVDLSKNQEFKYR
jgi:uridine kinase